MGKIKNNTETGVEGGAMNIIKKTVLGIKEYFKETYSDHVFRKVVSIMVVLCFVLNIANIPAYAKSERRAKDNKERNEQIIESGKTDTSEVGLVSAQEAMRTGSGEGVSTMNAIGNMSEEEVDSIIEIDKEGGVIKDKSKGNKVVAVYNAETEQVLGYAGQSDIVYYQALVNRKKELEKGLESQIGKTDKKGEGNREEIVEKKEKSAAEIAEVKGTVIGEYKKEDTVTNKQEEQKKEENVATIETIGEKDSIKEETKIESSKEYETVVEELSKQSGVSKEEVSKGLEEALSGKSEEEKESVIGLLTNFISQGGSIVNCAIDALSEVLNIASKGVLGLQALLVEISTGIFEKNNEENITNGDNQLMTSMATMQAIMEQYGQEAIGYASGIETFMEGMKAGDSAIVWVNEDHYITVSKLDNGNYTIVDPNVRGGEAVEYSASGLKSVLCGQEGIDVNGKEVGVSYNAQGQDGKIRVLSTSEGLKEQVNQGKAQEIIKEEMKEITGAKYVTETRTVEKEVTKKATRIEKRTREEEKTETATGSYTDSEGVRHSYTYTYTYTVTVEYEVEVEYEVTEIVTETYEEQVWVDDPEDEKETEQEKEAREARMEEENNKAKEEAERKALEEAERRAADRVKEIEDENTPQEKIEEYKEQGLIRETEESKERINEYNSMSNEEFAEAVQQGKVKIVNEVIKEDSIKITSIKDDKGNELPKDLIDGINKEMEKDNSVDKINEALKQQNVQNGAAHQNQNVAPDNGEKDILKTAGNILNSIADAAQNVANNLKDKIDVNSGNPLVNCAAIAVVNVLQTVGKTANAGAIALQNQAADLAAGLFKNGNKDNQTSIAAMIKTLNDNGQNYKAYSVKNVEGIKEGLKDGAVVLHVGMKNEKGKEIGHYITIGNGEKDGTVTIKDPNKKDVTVSKNDLGKYLNKEYGWNSGAMISKGEISNKNGKELSVSEQQDVKGAGLFSRAKNYVKKKINNARRYVKKKINNVRRTVRNYVNSIKSKYSSPKRATHYSKSKQPHSNYNKTSNPFKKAWNSVKTSVQNTWNQTKTNIQNGWNNFKSSVNVGIKTFQNNIAQRNLENQQRNAERAARTGTPQQQQAANEKLRQAETRSNNTSSALAKAYEQKAQQYKNNGNTKKADEFTNAAQNVRNDNQTKIYKGQLNVADARVDRAKKDFDNAVKSGNEKDIEKTRKAYVDAAANKGKVADSAVSEMEKSGNKDGKKQIENMANKGLDYSGNGKNYEEKMSNNARVGSAQDISDKYLQDYRNALKDKNADLADISEKAAKAVAFAEQEMNDTGNSEKVKVYADKIKDKLGLKKDDTKNKDVSLSQLIENMTAEVTAQRQVEDAQSAYTDAKDELNKANEDYAAAVESGEGVEKARAARKEAEQKYLDAASGYGDALENYNQATQVTGNTKKYDQALKTAYETTGVVNISDKTPAEQISRQAEVYVAQERVSTQEKIIKDLEKKYSGQGATDYEQALNDYIESGDKKALERAIGARDAARKELTDYINGLEDMYEDLAQKQGNAGYDQKVIDQTRQDGQTAKDKYAEKVIKSDKSIQQKILDNLGGNYTIALTLKDVDNVEAAQARYKRELNALKSATEGLNGSYDALLSEEDAAKAKEENSKKVTEKTENVQKTIIGAMQDISDSVYETLNNPDATDAATQQAKKLLEHISTAGKDLATALTDFSIALTQSGQKKLQTSINDLKLAAQGIYATKDGFIVYYQDADGQQLKKEITLTKSVSDGDLYKQKEFIVSNGIDAWQDYIRGEGLLNTETLYNGKDEDGKDKVVYVATNIGYDPNEHTIALSYDFEQDYNDDIYFTDVKSGQKKILLENHTNTDYGSAKQNAMVYDAVADKKSDDGSTVLSTSVQDGYTTVNGINIKAAINGLDKVVDWSTNDKGKTVARVVDFVNGVGRKASGFEEIVINNDGSKEITRYDLSYLAEKKSGGSGSGSGGDTIVDVYKQILEDASSMKIKGEDDFYKGYKYIDNKWVDLENITVRSYSTEKQELTQNVTLEKGAEVYVTASNVGSDWRYNPEAVKIGSDITVQGKGPYGEVYTITGKTTGYDWTDLTKANFKDKNGNDVPAYAQTDMYGTPITATTTFSATEGFAMVDFSIEAIEADARKTEAAAQDEEKEYTPKYFYTDRNGNYVGGVVVREENGEYVVKAAVGATVSVKDELDDTYMGTVNSETVIADVLKGDGTDWTTAISERFGTPIYRNLKGDTSADNEGFGNADFTGDSSRNFRRTEDGRMITGIEVKKDSEGNYAAYYKDSRMQGNGADGKPYMVTLDEKINGVKVSDNDTYEQYISEENIYSSEDGIHWRQTGSYSDEKGFYGAKFTNTNDYTAYTQDGPIVNIKRDKNGNYVAQADDKDDTSTHTYLLTDMYNPNSGTTQQSAVMIPAGTKINKDFVNEGYKDFINEPQSMYWFPTPEQAQQIADSYDTESDSDDGFITDSTTMTTTWQEWDYEKGEIVYYKSETKASENTFLFVTWGNEYQTKLYRNGEEIFDSGKQDVGWNLGWSGISDSLDSFANGNLDVDSKILNAAGISIDKYENFGENLSVVKVSMNFSDGKGTVHHVQNTYTYEGDDFASVTNYKQDMTRTAFKTSNIVYNDNNRLIADFDNDMIIYNATGNSVEISLGKDNKVTGAAIYKENTAMIDNVWLGTVITEGSYMDFATGKQSGFAQNIILAPDYETKIGEYINGLSAEELSGTFVRAADANGVEYTLRPFYKDGHLTYNRDDYENKTVTVTDASEIERYRQEGYKVEVKSTYSGDGVTVYTLNIVKNDITDMDSGLKFNRGFADNDGEWLFGIDGIDFDASRGFVVTASFSLTDDEFKTIGDITVPPQGEGGGSSEEKEDIRFEVAAAINGKNMSLKAGGDEEAKVAITFGFGEFVTGKPIQNHSFSHFYAGTKLTFYDDSVLNSVNRNIVSLSNSSIDAGDIINQNLSATVTAGSNIVLKRDTGLSELAGTVIENGVENGSVEVENLITFKDSSTGEIQTVKATGTMQAGQTWADVQNKNFVFVESRLDANGNVEFGHVEGNDVVYDGKTDNVKTTEINNGDIVFGGKYNDGKIEMGDSGYWTGTVDLNKSITDIHIEKGEVARAFDLAGGIIGSIVGAVFDPIIGLVSGIIGVFTGKGFVGGWNEHFASENSILRQSAALMKDKQVSDVTSGEIVSAAFAGIAAIAAVAVAIAGILASPFTAGATAVGGVVLAGYIIGAAIGTTVAVVGAARAAFDASENIQMYIKTGNEEYLKAGLINAGLAIFSILSAGMAAEFGNMGAQLASRLLGKGALYATAVAAAKEGGKTAAENAVVTFAETTAKTAAGGAGRAVATEGSKFAAREMLKNPWAIRGILMGGSSAIDGAISGIELVTGINLNGTFLGGLHDLSRVFSIQGMTGNSQISDENWLGRALNTEIFDGLKISSLVWTAGYVFGPSIVRGVSGLVSGGLKNTFSNIGTNLGNFGNHVNVGWRETLSNIGKLFGGSGGGLTGAIQAWGSLGTNMYRMVALNIGMGLTGSGLRRIGLVGNEDSAFSKSSLGGLLNFVLGEMGVDASGRALSIDEVLKNSFANESLANSMMFGVIMYAFMPLVSGMAKGIRGVSAAEEAAVSSGSVFSDLLNGTKGFVNSIWEEGFNEGIVQGLVTPFVGPQAAEYISEFAFPDTSGNVSFMQTVQTANSRTYSGAQSAASSMTQLYASKGYGDITFRAVDNGNGNFAIVMSGMQGVSNSILQQAGIRDVTARYSDGALSFETVGEFSGDRLKALAEARSAVAKAFNIDESSLAAVSENTEVVSIGESLLGDVSNKYTISEVEQYYSGSKSGLQSIMMGAYNALYMPGFSGNIGSILASNTNNFSENQTVKKVIDAFKQGIKAADGVTPSQVKAPGLFDAFWKGDTRTSADMLGVEINAARIRQLYGNSEGNFDTGEFNKRVTGQSVSQQLEQLTSIVTLTQAGVNMEEFINAHQLSDVLSSMLQSDIKNEATESRMQIAQWGAMLARNGFANADTMKVIANELGIVSLSEQSDKTPSSLNDFGVKTLQQARELGTYVAVIQQAAFGNMDNSLLNEVKKYNEKVLDLENSLKGKTLEQQQEILQKEVVKHKDSTGTFTDSIMEEYLNSRNEDILVGQARDNIRQQIKELENKNIYNGNAIKLALTNIDLLSSSEVINLANSLDMRLLTGMSLAEMGVKIDATKIQFNVAEGNHIPRINIDGTEYTLSLADLIDADIVKSDNIEVALSGDSSYMLNVVIDREERTIVVDANSLPSGFATSNKYKDYVQTIVNKVRTIEGIDSEKSSNLDNGKILSKFTVAANFDNINPLNIDPLNPSERRSASERIYRVDEGAFSGKPLRLSYFDSFVTLQGLQNFFNNNTDTMNKFFEDLRNAKSLDELQELYSDSYDIIQQLSTEKFIGMEDFGAISDRISFLAEHKSDIEFQIKPVQDSLKDFMKEKLKDSEGKELKGIQILDAVHDYLTSSNLNVEQKTDWLMSFMYEYVSQSSMWGKGNSFSASQSEAISAFLAGYDIALGMGGGKTPIGTEATIIHRILLGESARCEILVGNEDLDNFTGGDAKKMFDLFGLKTVQSKQFRNNDGSWDIDGLLAAYQDANTVVIMSPTDRGFLKAEAAAKGGETARKINTALNSVTNMIIDEVHKVAQNQVSTVISNGNTPPTQAEINRAMRYAQTIDYKTILDNMKNIEKEMTERNDENIGLQLGTTITIDGQDVSVAKFRTEAEALAYKEQNVIAIVGTGPVADSVMLLGNANDLIKNSVGTDFNASEFECMIKGLFATDAVGGFADTEQGIKPVGTDGPQMNMVPSDYYIQMGVLLKRNMTNMNEIMGVFAQISKTSMSVSNKDITAGLKGVIRGMTGTAEGYEPHIQNITGSKDVYSISGENFDYKDANLNALDFNGTREQRKAALSNKLNELLDKISENDSVTDAEFDNFLFLAKDASTIEILREVVEENYDTLRKYGIEIYEFTNRTGKWNGAENVNGDLETIQESLSAVAKNYKKRRLIIANEFGMTGIDYQGLFNNFLFDSHLMTDSDIAQALKRNGRTVSEGYDKARWDAQRFLSVDSVAASASLRNYKQNDSFMEYAARDNGLEAFSADEDLISLFNDVMKDGADISDIIENNKEASMKLIALLNSIQTRDSVTRFNIQDATRDFALVKPFRTMMELTSNENVRRVLEKALEEQLGNMQYDADRDLTLSEDVKENEDFNPEKVLFDTFKGNVQSAIEVFSVVLQNSEIQNNNDIKKFIETHLAQLNTSINTFDSLHANDKKALAKANSVEEFTTIIKSFMTYLAPTNNRQSLQELSTAVSDTTLQQDLQTDWAKEKGLVVERDGKVYLTQVGQNYAQLAQNRTADISKVLAVILQMLLGGGAVPPEEEKELMLSVARTLKDKGITNINGLNNFVNLLSSDNETLEFIQKAEFGITELKNIVEAQHPQGMNEKTLARILLNNPDATEVEIALKANEISLPTAQSVAVRRFMQQGKEDKLLQQYDSLVKDFYMMQSQKYALSAQERARIFTQNRQAKSDAFERNYPVLATTTGIGKKLALAPLSIIMLIPKFAIMGAVGRLLPFGNMQSSNMLAKAFNSFIGVSTADMLLNKNNNGKSNVQELSLPETALSSVYGIGNIVNAIKNKKALVKAANNVSALVNLKLSEAALMSTEEIKAKLATAGIEINKDIDTTIANMKEYFDNLSSEEDKSAAKGLTLKDISKFESVKDKKEEKSVENEEDTDMQAVSGGEQETGKVIPFVSKCAKTAVEGMGMKYDENKTAGDYVLDVLKVAGIMTKGAVSIAQSFMGTVRANLGQDYEYAILTDTSKLDNDVIAYYENEKGQGHVEKVRNRAEIEAKEIEGYKFTGIVLADKKVIKETETMNEIYSTEAVKEILKVMDTSKLSKEMVVEIEETLGTVINGVTAPEEMNLTVSAVLAICENANEIAQLIGYKDIEEVKSAAIEDIISKYNEKAGQVLSIEDIDKQDMQATIKILSVTRDMLIMVKKDESMIEKLDNPKTTVEDIMSKLIISKAVNQNIVTELVKESVGRSDGDKDFVIDIEKLRSAITEKITVKNAEDKLKELGALLVQGRGAGKKSMPIALMKISDIRAVAAAA